MTAPTEQLAAPPGSLTPRCSRQPRHPRARWACKGEGDRATATGAAALGALPQIPAAPSQKMREEGNLERGGSQGERRVKRRALASASG